MKQQMKRYNPWPNLLESPNWMDHFWNEVSNITETSNNSLMLHCELNETDDEYQLSMDIPGMKRDDIHLKVDGNHLYVSGERQSTTEKSDKTKKLYFSEKSYGSFSRGFTLPSAVDPEKVEACYEEGVLQVKVAKSSPNSSRKINIS